MVRESLGMWRKLTEHIIFYLAVTIHILTSEAEQKRRLGE